MVAHIDSDAHHALGMVTVKDLMEINSNLSTGAAEQVSKAISFFSSLSKSYKMDRSLTKRNVDSPFSYDPTRNLVHSYLVNHPTTDVNLNRFIMPKSSVSRRISPLDKRFALESAWWSKAQGHPSLRKRSFNVAAKDDKSKWAVLYGRDVSVVVEDEDRGFIHSVVTTVEDSWNVLLSVLRRVGISISVLPFSCHLTCPLILMIVVQRLFDKIRSAFAFDDILRTNQFLGTFYRLLAPLGIRGMDLLKRNYKESLANITDNTQSLFEDVISSLGGKDISLEKMRENAAHNADTVMRKGTVRLPSHLSVNGTDMVIPGIRDPLDADAKTHFLHDRIVNNLDAAALDLGNSTTWTRIQKLAGEAANSLASVASRDTMMAAHMHTLKFVSKTNLASISLVQILNFVRSLAVFSEQVSGKLLESFLNFLPLYWNLATALMMLPLKIPFIYGLWTKKFTKGTSDFTILDMLTLAGSVYGTWHYKMFNGNKAPFTDADIKVFKKVTQPELFLYTWNHDHSTYAMDSPQLQHHRLGIYDWIPRLHMTVTNTLQILAFDITMAIGGGSAGSPGALTIAPQVFSAIVGIMGRIAGYPFTQLESDDPELVKTSMMNPDRKWRNL